MKLRKLKKGLAISIALSLTGTVPAFAAEIDASGNPGEVVDENTDETVEEEVPKDTETDIEDTEDLPQEEPPAELPAEPPTEPEIKDETPKEYEARTGYHLPEGYEYVLSEGGFVLLLEDGTPKIQQSHQEEVQEPEGEPPAQKEDSPVIQGETPEAYEARTGYQLPEGYHYVLDGNGCVILSEDGSPQIEETSEDTPGSNEELIAGQQIVKPPVIPEDFRFWTVARKYGFAKQELEIKEEMSQEARTIGTLKNKGLCYILKEEGDWLYVESGRVRGFVKKEQLFAGEEARDILEAYQRDAKSRAASAGEAYTGIHSLGLEAAETVPWRENRAFLYLRATADQTVAEKKFALCSADLLNIREDKTTDSRIVGTLSRGHLAYILADEDQEWIYIESGDVRGFVKREYISFGQEIQSTVEQTGEGGYGQAQQLVAPRENGACYYTMTSVKSGLPGGELRNSVLDFASQFIGNPYVWGGTSLTEGADCSGFVQSIYREYGYELPRVAESQAQYGMKIPVEDAQPGDLVFYAKDGQIYHVVIYAGEGKTIEAMGTDYGIVQGNLNTQNAVWATRVLEDTQYVYGAGDLAEENAQPEMYGEDLGNFTLTYSCACELCCDQETGMTATGTPIEEGRTIGADPSLIPSGTQVIINGHIFTAEDWGGAVSGKQIQVYVNSHEKAEALGSARGDVYLAK